MNTEFGSRFLFWTTNIIEPVKLINQELGVKEQEELDNYFYKLLSEWKLTISISLLQPDDLKIKRAWLTSQQLQVVMISDLIKQYLFRDKRIWTNRENSFQIKRIYLKYLQSFEDLLLFAREKYPDIYDQTVKVTDYQSLYLLPVIRNSVNLVLQKVKEISINEKLFNIVAKGMNQLVCPGKATTAGIRYISHFAKELSNQNILSHDQFVIFLIRINFNHPEFYLYQTERITQKMIDIDGLHEELEYVYRRKEILNDISQGIGFSLFPRQKRLKTELQEYYNEKTAYLNDLLNLRRQSLQDKFDSNNSFRIFTTMSVPQLALFVRILKEKEVVIKDGLGELFAFFARHFYTDKALFISSSSLLKKSTDTDFTTALKLWDMLVSMLDWLDEKFNIRNYKRSV